MIIGLCGTHGTGKSTILRGVEALGYPACAAQLSRTAQAALGWKKLSKAQETVENMWQLQEAILAALRDRDDTIERTGSLTLVERTPADVWAYTELWCSRLNVNYFCDERALDFKARCCELAKRYSRFLIVPTSDEVRFVEEPNRADLASRELISEAIYRFISVNGLPATVIRSVKIEDRITEVLAWLTTHEEPRGNDAT